MSTISADSVPEDYDHSTDSNPLVQVLAAAMAAGKSCCNSVDINNVSSRHRYSNDPTRYFTTTTTTLKIEIFNTREPSPFLPAAGQSREEAIRALLAGTWPLEIFSGDPNRVQSPITVSSNPSQPPTRANSPIQLSPPISIRSLESDGSIRFADPNDFSTNDVDDVSSTGADNNSINNRFAESPSASIGAIGQTPSASKRWYAVTTGLRVGVFQGTENVDPLIRGVSGGKAVKYPTQEAAAAAFSSALRIPGGVVVVGEYL